MIKRLLFSLVLLLILFFEANAGIYSDSIKSKVPAVRANETIKIDGILDESVWQRKGVEDFTQRDPNEGAKPTENSEILVAYDDNCIYFAARLYDSFPDSILGRLARRDVEPESDWLYIYLDPYHDKRSGYYFGVNPAGSISDGIIYNDSWTDGTWDGVWEVKTRIDAKGWIIEMRIPYSQLRFKEKDQHIWGCNFKRYISRKKEYDYYIMVPKKESGMASRFAELTGIENIHPPQRIEVLPYAVSSGKYLKHESGDPFNNGHLYNGNFGGDIKVGIGGNLTLDGTINPDFGQVEVDPAVVNLSQFETYYQEKRPFFIEGSNIFEFGYGGSTSYWSFNWGTPNFFYSRRIGRAPQGSPEHEGYADMPGNTTILGAAKLSGKIEENWSIGVLAAETQTEYADVDSSGVRFREKIEPATFYGVVRSLKEFNGGRQGLGIITTATIRDLDTKSMESLLNKKAFALGFDGWTFLDSSKTYVITGYTGFTNVLSGKEKMIDLQQSPQHNFQRPDADYLILDSSRTSLYGWVGRVMLNKQKGNFRLNAALGAISPGFETNDLGYQSRSDYINGHIGLGYSWYEPDDIFRTKSFTIAAFRSYNFGGDKIAEGYFLFSDAQLMNYWSTSLSLSYSPDNYTSNLTRGGPLAKNPYSSSINLSVYSDSRKAVVIGPYGYFETGGLNNQYWSLGVDCEWKPAGSFSLSIGPQYAKDKPQAQWVTRVDDPYAVNTYGARYIFANLNQTTISANIRIDWTFTPKLSLQVYLQPLFAVGEYSNLKELAKTRSYEYTKYGEKGTKISYEEGEYNIDPDGSGPAEPFTISDPNFNFKSLRGNAVLRWEYLPGSTLYLVWTHERVNSDDPGTFRINRDFRSLMDSEPDNIFLLKVTYWLNL
jgi:hypothetical protein